MIIWQQPLSKFPIRRLLNTPPISGYRAPTYM
jgi:hypothetical protein